MCFFKPPKIEQVQVTAPEVATPAAAPPPLETVEKVKGIDIGGDDKDQKELGAKKSAKKGKSSLRIDKKPAAKTTGANYANN